MKTDQVGLQMGREEKAGSSEVQMRTRQDGNRIESFRQPEPLVSAEVVSKYLGFTAIQVRKMAREGRITSVPFPAGKRTSWRFRMSDLEKCAIGQQVPAEVGIDVK